MEISFPDYLPSIHHDGSSRYIHSGQHSEIYLGDVVTVRLRAAAEAPIQRVLLRICPDGEQRLIDMKLEVESSHSACQWWRVEMSVINPLMYYRFLFFTPEGVFWYNARGVQLHVPTDSEDFRLLAGYQSPDWVGESVFYQIFPDRFADGDSSLNVRDGEFEELGVPAFSKEWGVPPANQGWEEVTEYYGGDLIGIREKLGYLEELGVNALYLNPIFTAYSNHRYDVADYFQVDSHLGGNEALTALRQATKQWDMHYILDIVPNHCGYLHPWFKAAQADLSAPSVEYFMFRDHPHDFESWLGVPFLPKLNYRSQPLREIMYAGEDSIFRHWLQPPYSADGWRIDVANMLGRLGSEQLGAEVCREIRQAVKTENPNAYLLGEHFFDATSQLQGDSWDGVMNYTGFTNPLMYWLKHFQIYQHHEPRSLKSEVAWTTKSLVDTWQAYLAAIPWVIARQQFNLLGSHDTPRIASILNGNNDLIRLAVGVLMTFPGIPCIYYGDEIGLGVLIHGTRQCMLWDRSQWDNELFAYYKKLVRLRRSSKAMIEGGFQVFFVAEDAFAYLRDTDTEFVIVIANRSSTASSPILLPVKHAGVANGMVFTELFSGRRLQVSEGCMNLSLHSPGVEIWISRV